MGKVIIGTCSGGAGFVLKLALLEQAPGLVGRES